MDRYFFVKFPEGMSAVANVDSYMISNVWTLRRINVPEKHRGKGHGSDLLRQVCEAADEAQMPVQLTVYASGALDDDQLTAWYKRYGFEVFTATEGGHPISYMERQPVRKES